MITKIKDKMNYTSVLIVGIYVVKENVVCFQNESGMELYEKIPLTGVE